MENENKVFGSRLKYLRNKIGKNQEDVAKAIKISRARYSHYENNHVEPDIDLINRLATYFDVTTDYLLGRSDNPRLDKKEQKEISELDKIIKSLPEEERRKIINLVKAFAEMEQNED